MDDTEINFPSEEESYENYSIPQDILNLIDLEFLTLFKHNLCIVFKMDDISEYSVCCLGGTGGWQKALHDTSFELKKLQVIGYYDSIPWWKSDYFDGKISDLMVESKVIEKDLDTVNSAMDELGLSLDYEDDDEVQDDKK